jgi:hypothetical protein
MYVITDCGYGTTDCVNDTASTPSAWRASSSTKCTVCNTTTVTSPSTTAAAVRFRFW